MRIIQKQDPYIEANTSKGLRERGSWPCKWVTLANPGETPYISAYRCKFSMEKAAKVRIHVSADERYELFLDGKRVGRGSERGDANNWFYESYELDIPQGDHIFVARVWVLGANKPLAQISVYPGFILSPEGDGFINLFGTGVAPWEAKRLDGYSYTGTWPAFGVGANQIVDGTCFPWGYERGEGDGWTPVVSRDEGFDALSKENYRIIHLMKPAPLPSMMERPFRAGTARFVGAVESDKTLPIPVRMQENIAAEMESWNLIKTEGSVTIPPNTRRRVIIDLEDYYCAYPEVITSGGKGSMVRVLWSESLYNVRPRVEQGMQFMAQEDKGNRNEVDGKYFWGLGDIFKPDGGKARRFDTVWWQCGRYLEVLVQTAGEALTIDQFNLRETRYPMEMESAFECSEAELNRAIPIMWRALQMCSHETYMDCPFYEQSMYVGDTRLQILTTFSANHDDRLPRKALKIYDEGRILHAFAQSRYPTNLSTLCPPFALWWVAMVYDFALWRGDREFLKTLLPGVRACLNGFQERFINSEGLVDVRYKMDFMDWVDGWEHGAPPDAYTGISGMINWQLALVLANAADLEEYMGEPEMAARNRRWARDLMARIDRVFWDEKRGLYADDMKHTVFTEHTQSLAILSGLLDPVRRARVGKGLVNDTGLVRTTIYFTHYLFEAYRALGESDAFFRRLDLWRELEKMGFKTTYETPEPTRSDCHAWGAHPIYHFFATILGIRPGAMGFETVEIAPQLGPLQYAKGKFPHPKGWIEVDLQTQNGILKGTIRLPEGLSGIYSHSGRTLPLKSGAQEV